MQSIPQDQLQSATKVIEKADRWLDSRQAKAASQGKAKEAAQSSHRITEHELAEAVEKHRAAKSPGAHHG